MKLDKIEGLINSLLNNGEYEEALNTLDKLLSDPKLKGKDYEVLQKANYASFYFHIIGDYLIKFRQFEMAEKYLEKATGIINSCDRKNNYEGIAPYLMSVRAAGYMTKYELEYTLKRKDEDILYYADDVKNIFDIKDTIQLAISNYWNAYRYDNGKDEEYNKRNNLANSLAFVGRYSEALNLLVENIGFAPERFQSLGSWCDHLEKFKKNTYLGDMISIELVKADKFIKALKQVKDPMNEYKINYFLNVCAGKLSHMGEELTEKLIEKNKQEELEDFNNMSEYRRFTLSNNLSLNEHSLHCFCRDSEIDNLMIGLLDGSYHKNEVDFDELNCYVNRVKSEFSFARLNFYKYATNSGFEENDLWFFKDEKEIIDINGYKIEHLRTCFRVLYGILDKIANGVMYLFSIPKTNNIYFESFFHQYPQEFEKIQNIHLVALYSLSLDLIPNDESNRLGILGFYKKIRNNLEHNLLKVSNAVTNIDERVVNIVDFENFTFELMQLTRSAIFSFVFLSRSETIVIK